MSRNASGTYTLPAGNPVVTGTLIESSWANSTLGDIASALTDSLSRSGEGGMTAALRVVDGTVSAPGLAFVNETGSGLYRTAAGDYSLGVLGSQIMRYRTTVVAASVPVNFVASTAPTWDTNTYIWAEASFGARYDSFRHRFDVGNTRTEALRIESDGKIYAMSDIIANYSDERLKTKLGNLESALDKICAIETFYYEANETAQALGYKAEREVGVSAQSVQAVFPELVVQAPVDAQYLTVRYERLVAPIIEAIKELRAEVKALKGE